MTGLANPDPVIPDEGGEAVAGARCRLREAVELEPRALPGDGQHLIEATLIRAGRSKMGNVYPVEVLRAATPLFENARAFVDHPAPSDRPERSVRDLVGYYRDVRLEEDRVRGTLHLVPGNDWLFALLQEAQGNPELCGLSIDAWADRDARSGQVRRILRVNSIDIVTRPSAGGQLDHVLHAERSLSVPELPSDLTTPATAPAASATSPADAGLEQSERELRALVESLRQELSEARCGQLLLDRLEAANLPDPVAQKLVRRFDGRVFEAAELDEAIADERAVLAELAQQGRITGLGYEKQVSPGMNELERLQCAFDGLFDLYESEAARGVPRLSGIREAFQIAAGFDIGRTPGADAPLRESLSQQLRGRMERGRLSESEASLMEADVTTASFSYLLGTSMNKRLLMDYKAWPAEWQKFASIVAIKDFKQQSRVRLGAFGSLSTVTEDTAYTTLTLSDTQATYAATKRGNLVQITRETIINDDLYAIRQIPQKLAVAAAYTLAEFVYGLLAPGGGNIYDGHPLFDSVNHKNTGIAAANLGTAASGSALTAAALAAAVPNMRKQTNAAGKPLGLKPRFMLVPPDLEFTAITILKSAGLPGTSNNDINPMMGYLEPIVSPQLNAVTPAATTSWILVADPKVIDTVEVGFVGGQVNPVLLIQDMPLYGANFTQDVISYKVRHEYGGAVVDYRGFYLGNN